MFTGWTTTATQIGIITVEELWIWAITNYAIADSTDARKKGKSILKGTRVETTSLISVLFPDVARPMTEHTTSNTQR